MGCMQAHGLIQFVVKLPLLNKVDYLVIVEHLLIQNGQLCQVKCKGGNGSEFGAGGGRILWRWRRWN